MKKRGRNSALEGAPGALRCAGCGSTAPPEAKFCSQCGASLSAPEIQRRTVTFVFCDIVGSTTLANKLDPEDLREVILEYRQICIGAVRQFDGHVARYFGDGVLIYFGYPRAHDDDAARAIRTGLSIVASVRKLSAQRQDQIGSNFEVHLGIHTGEAVVGEMGDGTEREVSSAIGSAPNVAALLERAASPGNVLISRDTAALVGDLFDCESLGEISLKGYSKKFEVFRVIAERSPGEGSALLRVKARATMVGRNEEFAILLKQWAQAKNGSGRVQMISGEPGIGKSRLLREFAMRVDGEGYEQMICHCLPQFSNSALFPFVDLLERWLGFDNDTSLDRRMELLVDAFRTRKLPQLDALPLVATLLKLPVKGAPLTTQGASRARRDRTMEWILNWLLSRADSDPLTLMVEDIHWADASTLEFLTLLLDRIAGASIFILLTFRSEFAPPWKVKSTVNYISLSRLPPSQSKRLIAALAKNGTLSEQVIDQVVQRSDGVPLFVEEITKSVLETGGRLGADDSSNTVASADTSPIPATLRGLLTARLDRLGNARALAQVASVIGREFSYRLIAAVTNLAATALRSGLDRLVEAELLYQRGHATAAIYGFNHALIQDAAYRSLLKSKRVEYHETIAKILSDRDYGIAEANPEILAHHYDEAGNYEQAVEYWHRAGARALESSAEVEAMAHLRAALGRLRDWPSSPRRLEKEISCLVTLGAALTAVQGYGATEVEQTYARAYALSRGMGNTPDHFAALAGLLSFYQVRGPLDTAHEIAERLLTLAQQGSDKGWLGQAHRRLGWCLFSMGRIQEGRQHLEFALTLFDEPALNSQPRIYGAHPPVIGLVNLALLEWVSGRPDTAVERGREAVRQARERSRPLTLAYALCMSAAVHQCRGDADQTSQLAREVVALSKEHGFPYWSGWGSVLLGWTRTEAGQIEEGLADLREGLRLYEATGAQLFLPSSYALLAQCYGKAGRLPEAIEAITHAKHSADLLNGYFFAAEIERIRGELLVSSGRGKQEAEEFLRRALDQAREQGAASLQLRAACSLAEFWLRQGRKNEACALLKDALSGIQGGSDTVDLLKATRLLREAMGA